MKRCIICILVLALTSPVFASDLSPTTTTDKKSMMSQKEKDYSQFNSPLSSNRLKEHSEQIIVGDNECGWNGCK